jgi:STE24 endopeptidase
MQLLILALAMLLFAHDQAPSLVSADFPWPLLAAVVLVPRLALFGLYHYACRVTGRRLTSRGAARSLRRLELFGGVYRVAGLALFASDLHFGLLVHTRAWITALTGFNQTVLLDELLVMLPTLAMWGLGWWAYYPIDRRLRDASMMRRFDRGQPVYPMWTRRQYVVSQYRYQVALILVPLLAVFAWAEAVQLVVERGWASPDTEAWWTLGGCVAIFLFAPLMIRLIWDTVPLPDGEVRRHLLNMCKTHRVRVRELLLWRTYGGMINAAVMGLVGPLRFILITDALLQQMPGPHVEAVMAHELAHVRKRHMFWLLVSAVGLMGVIEAAAVIALAVNGVRLDQAGQTLTVTADGADVLAASWGSIPAVDSPQAWVLVTVAASVAVWIVAFGWVSRRIERQADSFAVAHFVRERGGDTVEARDAQTMIDALQHVADLNHVRTGRHSWRHGSIQWRQAYLRLLVGGPVNRLPIDRQMRLVNGLSAAAVIAIVALQAWLG